MEPMPRKAVTVWLPVALWQRVHMAAAASGMKVQECAAGLLESALRVAERKEKK